MSCRPIIFDPPEWLYVMTLVKTLLPQLSFHRDLEATEAAERLDGVSIDVLKDLDWGAPAIYMPPFEKTIEGTVVVAVEGYSAKKLARRGVKVDVVVGDYDFDAEGYDLAKYAVVHLHGDNYWTVPKRDWIYTVQTWPRRGCVYNISGFTDGDRAIYLAYYMGARAIYLSGHYPQVVLKRDDEVKKKKLTIANHLLNRLRRRIEIETV
ncbi:MAG: hypothetical protein QXK67_02040 [Pyrobaculum sp.]